ncbi:FHA domain-containing protein [Arthrobacter sp. Marseille-P9274]|uniref:FHA domain-containing protein n=1 Tax=Arthrobacter sp. Marseille-P9274 TaxID=2866572 RepID=UPI0027BA5BFD|nr:FHA domain-containing protein [Arthrobacter sp. Marseille-P9274]
MASAPQEVPASSVSRPAGPAAQAEDELAFTRLRSDPATEAPAPAEPALAQQPRGIAIRFDDGREVTVEGTVLIGRNPAAAEGEDVEHLIDFADMGRSVSKTHLQLRVDGATVWVADRNSTNGTAVTGADGFRNQLTPGSPVAARIGDTVHFGDRSFTIGQA